ncbi:pyridoxal phosphate-dependent aminotransferase [Chitinophaga sancti]|uniref:Aminotransferase n=1 Tax=Chitinophaga sancti TaxID=1004 RepID=A0A1K1NHS2_9BACT|nr:aminotransferase class I/II-fold pyridoxal phosphate-dependent enzyme [Chitinophaga sancti]WQD63217.1 aminotransferase class I/II-fold pyridoxal phosphate-dependent enzyme [Chitinophaga sancti]WQG91157.1 aminotransferase class I/II-fold pyridoxal phosphate-dependent enzyme [Chitinophaga sancti]SFW34821.1 threonine-phosphate decarboxylase [Chitinophaga sancti]
MILGHGDDRYLYSREILADFSSNVYYKGLSIGLIQHLSTQLFRLKNYPEANAQSLQEALAQWHAITPAQVLATNGATEAFYLVAHAWRRQSATIVIPAFAEYEDACRVNDISVSYLEWSALQQDSSFETELVFLGNPNNPTGALLTVDFLRNLLQHNPAVTFVIDEAYVDFTLARASLVDSLGELPNLVIIKSLTKTYAIPGLRLGYMLSNAETISAITASKMPWSVNALAIEAGLYITAHKETLTFRVEELLQDTVALMAALRIYVNVMQTNTNFFLCELLRGTAAELKAYLLEEHGLLIRDAGNFKSLSERHFRVATQTPEKNALLIKGIDAWMAR